MKRVQHHWRGSCLSAPLCSDSFPIPPVARLQGAVHFGCESSVADVRSVTINASLPPQDLRPLPAGRGCFRYRRQRMTGSSTPRADVRAPVHGASRLHLHSHPSLPPWSFSIRYSFIRHHMHFRYIEGVHRFAHPMRVSVTHVGRTLSVALKGDDFGWFQQLLPPPDSQAAVRRIRQGTCTPRGA